MTVMDKMGRLLNARVTSAWSQYSPLNGVCHYGGTVTGNNGLLQEQKKLHMKGAVEPRVSNLVAIIRLACDYLL